MSNLKLFLSGMIIGVAGIIPGLSGGTLAVILNIYTPIINAIQACYSRFFWTKRKPLLYLSIIGLGSVSGIFIFSHFIRYLLYELPHPTAFFFISLIIGSLPNLYKTHMDIKTTFSNAILFLIAFISMAALSFTQDIATNSTSIYPLDTFQVIHLILSGFIGAATMVFPGVSGSLVLIMMGSYFLILEAISQIYLPILMLVSLGASIGILLSSKLMSFCLTNFPSHTYHVILGLMIGSLFILYPGLPPAKTLLHSVLASIVGILTIPLLSHLKR